MKGVFFKSSLFFLACILFARSFYVLPAEAAAPPSRKDYPTSLDLDRPKQSIFSTLTSMPGDFISVWKDEANTTANAFDSITSFLGNLFGNKITSPSPAPIASPQTTSTPPVPKPKTAVVKTPVSSEPPMPTISAAPTIQTSTNGGVTEAELNQKLAALEQVLSSRISTSNSGGNSYVPAYSPIFVSAPAAPSGVSQSQFDSIEEQLGYLAAAQNNPKTINTTGSITAETVRTLPEL